jgi:spore coat protein U-like protein
MKTATHSHGKRSGTLRLAFWLGLAAGPIGLAQTAQAATATGPMTVTATVASTCAVGASSLAFGSIPSTAILAGNIDATGTVTVNCTSGSSYSVALNAGLGTDATVTVRKMSASAQLLSYTIYTSAERTTVWGDGTVTSVPITGTGTGAMQTISAYGRIFSGQNITASAYSDTVNVTITY